jgi:DNA polymerase I
MQSSLRNNNQHPMVIIDAHGFAYRAYYSHPKLTNPQGEEVGAIYGFMAMLIRLLARFAPQKAIAVFDGSKRNFRHELYSEYKLHRPPTPEDLKPQLSKLWEVADALNLKTLSKDGYEADDLIASIAHKFQHEVPIVIFSSDKDLLQLVNERVSIVNPSNEEHLKIPDVEKKFGVPANRFVDYLALVGDAADNVPGVKGIGPKSAIELVKKFADLTELFENIQTLTGRQKELLVSGKEMALLSMQLVTLKKDAELNFSSEDLNWQLPEREKIMSFFTKHAFKSLINRMNSLYDVQSLYKSAETPQDDLTRVIESEKDLAKELEVSKASGYLCMHVENKPKLRVYCSNKIGECFVINEENLSPQNLLLILSYIEDLSIKKIAFNFKAIMHELEISSEKVNAVDDLLLMRYSLATSGAKINSASSLVQEVLGANSFANTKVTSLMRPAYFALKKSLFKEKLLWLYHELDLPSAYSLHKMEKHGVLVDLEKLQLISHNLSCKIKNLEEEIFALCGSKFNIASTKQLSDVLYNLLDLPSKKKLSKSKLYSTDAETLEELSRKGFPIAGLILSWRGLSKLKSTYADALKAQVNLTTGRVHTTLLQTSTSTGRLSSANPNLQNIPIRTLEGREIRSAFIAPKGYLLLSADYSQIELRILSFLAGVKKMQNAFSQGQDIHTITAEQVFGVKEVDSELRRRAKAVNFGIIYGSTSFGIAKQLNLTHAASQQIIDSYFDQYPEILAYMEQTKEFARRNGYVLSALGRKCSIENINDKNYTIRSLAERAAINAPIQGTAADIMKLIMLRIEREALRQRGSLLLQVHDELLFECRQEYALDLASEVKAIMENAVSIPLKVNLNFGSSWQGMKAVSSELRNLP